MKKNIILFLGFFLTAMITGAQIAPDKYYVQFTDKNNSPYSISNPEAYLSQRAIDRRNRQNIAIDMKDIPVNPQYLQGVIKTGATILNPTKWLNGTTIYTDNPSVIAAINLLPYVSSVSKSEITGGSQKSGKAFFENEDYDVSPSAYLQANSTSTYDYGPSYNQISMLNGDQLHALGYRGEGIIIGVLDAGYDNANNLPVFDSLWADGRVLGNYDFVDGGAIQFDKHFHGTGVLSLMAGNYPGQIVGTAPRASYYLFRTEDGASEYIIEEYNWVSGAEYADSVGCDVLNTSLGYSEFPDDPTQNHTYEDMDGNTTPITIGADVAASRGMVVVNSAGNSGAASWYYISAPADGNLVFTIGAVNAAGIPWISSGNGPTYDGRIKPNVAAQGEGAYYATPNGTFTQGNGTSLSSPITAGMMACLWQACPDISSMELMNAVQQSASKSETPDNKIGWGIPDFMAAHNLLSVTEHDEDDRFSEVSAYPNPFKDFFEMRFNASESGTAKLAVVDMTGRIIIDKNYTILRGNNIVRFNELGNIPSGIYFLRLESGRSVLTSKLLRQ